MKPMYTFPLSFLTLRTPSPLEADTHHTIMTPPMLYETVTKEGQSDENEEEGAAIAIGRGCGGGAWDTATQPMP